MKLTVFNGSPRGKEGNTEILLRQLSEGFLEAGGEGVETWYIGKERDHGRALAAFQAAECVLLAFPLYFSSMPGVVKEFIEALEPLCQGGRVPPIAFVVQNGYPEARHSRAVERYLEKLARRIGARHLGTAIKASVEGIQAMPTWMLRGSFLKPFRALGRELARTGRIDESVARKLARPERLEGLLGAYFRGLLAIGGYKAYWDRLARLNGGLKRVSDQPYARPE